jgi:hypothetical protein
MQDLHAVQNGALASHLNAVLTYAQSHVYECRLCAQKGFICEICNHSQILYPFQTDTTYRVNNNYFICNYCFIITLFIVCEVLQCTAQCMYEESELSEMYST